MVRGSFQRVAMTILMLGLMIAPLGLCLQPSSNGAHSCCMQSESSHSLHVNCCVARPQLPATVVAPTLPGSSPSEVLQAYVPVVDAVITEAHSVVAVIPPLSPPNGAFILRI